MDIFLRKWQLQDAKRIQPLANDMEIAKYLRNGFPYPYAEQDAETYIQFCLSGDENVQLCRAIVVDGQVAGSIGVFCQNPHEVYAKSAEIGYWLGRTYWGKGIMREAIKQICREAFETYDIVRIFAEPYANNIGSRKALEYAGFQLEGIMRKSVFKNGEIVDGCLYARLDDENEDDS